MNGKKDALGMYVGEIESAKFWLSIMNGLKNRGVEGILICPLYVVLYVIPTHGNLVLYTLASAAPFRFSTVDKDVHILLYFPRSFNSKTIGSILYI